jgi:hypothetical protein
VNTIEKWLTGLTVVAVVSTVVTSPYSGSVINAIGGVISGAYRAVKAK